MSKIFAIDGVKILGRAIGAAKPSKPSEVDGDGDGFLTGPDGRDNVPAPKAVVDTVKKAGRVADILKPTDDLFDVRKSGRPWKPLLLEHQPKEWFDEYQKLAMETRDRLIARGKKRREIEDEWKKKYGWNGSFALQDMAVVPDDVAQEAIKKYWTEYLDHRSGDSDLLKRMTALDEQFKENIRNKFKEQESKAIQAGKGEKFAKDFKTLEQYLFRNGDVYRDLSPAEKLNDAARNAYWRATGGEYIGEDVDQFALAAKNAKDIVSNPNKRVVVHVDPKMLEAILEDKKMKNFFQVKRNEFIDAHNEMAAYDKWGAEERKRTYMRIRLRTEQSAFGLPKSGFEGKNRPIYGMLMPDGVVSPAVIKGEYGMYGAIGIVMKHDVESRTTFTIGDSANFDYIGGSPINDPGMGLGLLHAKGMLAYGDKEQVNRNLAAGGYAEAQIFGGVSVNDIAYINIADEVELPPSVLETLRKLNIPVVNHKVETVFVEPEELRVKADVVAEGFVLFATRNNDRLFVPNKRPEEGDLSGMISLDGKKAKPIENVLSILNFGYWELV